MKSVKTEALLSSERFYKEPLLTEEAIDLAIKKALKKIDRNIAQLGEMFPEPATRNFSYQPMENTEWTNGFWTGILWLAYELTDDDKYKHLAFKHVDSFLYRIENRIELDHHDLGFLYSLSCVSAYKLTGKEKARKAALLAANKLMERWQEKGQFIQAWGELGEDYRLIVDCLLNIPLLYWAHEETGELIYKDAADKHYQTTLNHAVRADASAYHTFYFDNETGEPLYGKTRQGYSDESSWARGQAWLIYGIALNHHYEAKNENFKIYSAVTNYFLNRLPKDFVSYWDLIFGDGSGQARDSSATAIAVCGMNEMNKHLPESNPYKDLYRRAQHAMLHSLIDNYTENKTDYIGSLINEGVYSWHSGKGVGEGNIWGDYFYLEALVRFKKDWKMYW